MPQKNGKCDLDFRNPGFSESPNGNGHYLDCNFNNGMVIGSDAEILVRLLAAGCWGENQPGSSDFVLIL
jgi:hypothetical protein